MPTRSSKSDDSGAELEARMEEALGAIVGSGWADPPATPPQTPPEPHLALPAPLIEEQRQVVAQGQGLQYAPVMPARREREDGQDPEPPNKAILDIGLLGDYVTGARNAEDTAQAAGVTLSELHSALATTLNQIDPKELAKAMGIQVAVTQLKAGAIFNALLADLLEDIRQGRAKADQKLELLKILKGVGRLEPKEDKGVGGGTGFSLNINIGAGAPPVVIESNN